MNKGVWRTVVKADDYCEQRVRVVSPYGVTEVKVNNWGKAADRESAVTVLKLQGKEMRAAFSERRRADRVVRPYVIKASENKVGWQRLVRERQLS